jgi:hypothetical protein
MVEILDHFTEQQTMVRQQAALQRKLQLGDLLAVAFWSCPPCAPDPFSLRQGAQHGHRTDARTYRTLRP